MKAATGETTLTIITIVAIGAILAFFWVWWGGRQKEINDDWGGVKKTGERSTNYIIL